MGFLRSSLQWPVLYNQARKASSSPYGQAQWSQRPVRRRFRFSRLGSDEVRDLRRPFRLESMNRLLQEAVGIGDAFALPVKPD
jgi:hypothetical protein